MSIDWNITEHLAYYQHKTLEHAIEYNHQHWGLLRLNFYAGGCR